MDDKKDWGVWGLNLNLIWDSTHIQHYPLPSLSLLISFSLSLSSLSSTLSSTLSTGAFGVGFCAFGGTTYYSQQYAVGAKGQGHVIKKNSERSHSSSLIQAGNQRLTSSRNAKQLF